MRIKRSVSSDVWDVSEIIVVIDEALARRIIEVGRVVESQKLASANLSISNYELLVDGEDADYSHDGCELIVFNNCVYPILRHDNSEDVCEFSPIDFSDLEKEFNLGPKCNMTCPNCGGENVYSQATVYWDAVSQGWENDGEIHAGMNYCNDCDEIVEDFDSKPILEEGETFGAKCGITGEGMNEGWLFPETGTCIKKVMLIS